VIVDKNVNNKAIYCSSSSLPVRLGITLLAIARPGRPGRPGRARLILGATASYRLRPFQCETV
jgi:hypothetical protein